MSTVTSRLFLHTFPSGSVITVSIGDELAYVASCDFTGLKFEAVDTRDFQQSQYITATVKVVGRTAKGRPVVALCDSKIAEADPAFASAIAFAERFV